MLRVVLAVVALLILAAVLVAAAYYFVPSFKEAVLNANVAHQMPAELTGAVFVGIDGKDATLYRLKGLMFEPSAEQLVPAGALSPDGASYVYARLAASSTPATVDPAKSVVYVSMRGAQPKILAFGYAPAYLDATHIVYFAPGGISVRDTAAGTTALLFARATTTPLYEQVKYSPDRTMMLWTDAKTNETVLAHITPTSYKPLHVFVGLRDAVLTDTALYAVRPSPQGSQLWRYALDGSSEAAVLTFPQSLRIGQLFL